MFGLVVSPGNVPDTAELAALRPRYLRSILYSIRDVDDLVSLGLPIMVTVNNQMAEVGGDWSGWDRAIEQIVEHGRGRIFAVCVGNEFDLYNADNPDDVPAWFAADLVQRAASILRPYGIKTVATSVASRIWPGYLSEMADICRDDADWFDIHPYGQRPDGWGEPGWFHGDLRATLLRARDIAGKPVICSEIGVKLGDAGGEQAVADFMLAAAQTVELLGPQVCPSVAWFAWRDQVGGPHERGDHAFGLVAEDGRRRPAWYAFAALNPGEPAPEPLSQLVGHGIQTELDRRGWTASSGEYAVPIARAGTPAGQERLIIWDEDGASAWRRVG